MKPQPFSCRTVTVKVILFPFEGLAGMTCQSCRGDLDICQPDPNRPDRFLATCPECGEWSLIDSSEGDEMASLISLAPLEKIRVVTAGPSTSAL